LPVSADLEDCYGEDPDGVAKTVELAVLALPGAPLVGELAEAGVARVSVGGAFAFAALGSAVEAARELREQGTYGYLERTKVGRDAVKEAFP
jgi:2-methylisocitrate lyase-like PEP mutase family enzyme